MALKLQLWFLVLFVRGIVAVQHITMIEGKTLALTCRIRNAARSPVEWMNPKGEVMFFNAQKALRDKRYRITNLSATDFSISVSDVTFKDGGLYTCSHYSHITPVKKMINVTVLGKPTLVVTEHNEMTVVKCSVKANSHPPKISWMFESGLEIFAQLPSQTFNEKNTYSSTDILHVQSHKKKVTIKCFAHHPTYNHLSLMDFVTIGTNHNEELHSTRAPYWTSKGHPTEILSTSTSKTFSHWPKPQVSIETSTTTATDWPNTRGSRPSTPDQQLSTHSVDLPSVSQTTEYTPYNDTGSNSTNARDLTSVSQTTEDIPYNVTQTNSTDAGGSSINGTESQRGSNRNSPLLIFLVTCLIFGLLVVVVFFGIKLRRAHMLWKKENEDSDQSVESSKSKSSNEEKQSRGRRANGLFNIGFTKYVIEEPTSTETNSISTSKNKIEEAPVIHVIPQKDVSTLNPQMKETEL
ncbi:hypothetical protein UPYG_G00125570 [Umbra pygmaea]|uniref:Ig-like domain-containing protein n=1 Tax=Umbra pygmaea TaxID=75934 RepID=A0ABD0XN61_UMBPY